MAPSEAYAIRANVFELVEKIDQFVESKKRVTLIHKMGFYYHGVLTDTWVRISGVKLRGKVKMESDEKGPIEIEATDILDLRSEE